MVQLGLWLWAGVLILGVVAAHWGAEKLAAPLKKLRRQWGFTAVAGGTFVGLAAASPETSINIVSAYRSESDIGLGTMLGSNIVSIPLIVTVAYVASRKQDLLSKTQNQSAEDSQPNGKSPEHGRHRQEQLLRVKRETVFVLTLPTS